MLGHYTTPPVFLSIPIGCPCCQRKRTCLGSKALARKTRYLRASAREVHQVHQVRTGTWPRRRPARDTPYATCSDRGRGAADSLHLDQSGSEAISCPSTSSAVTPDDSASKLRMRRCLSAGAATARTSS